MTDVTTTRICNECGLAYRESLLPHQCAEWTRGRTEQSSTTEASETADLNTECAFIHALPSGSVRCGALRQHHSQYTGHKFTEPRPPAPRAGQWRTVGQVVPECDYKIAGMTVIQKSASSELVALVRDREIAERILVEHNQHATLVEQRDTARGLVTRLTIEKQKVEQDRERLMASLKRMLNNFLPYSSENTEQYREEYEAYEEAQLLITTIEQSGKNAGRVGQ